MMLDVDFAKLRQGFLQYMPIGALIGIVFLLELILVVGAYVIDPALVRSPGVPIPPTNVMTNTEAIGQVLYTRYFFFFQAAGLILLVAMIGAIVLTLRERLHIKRQNIAVQNARTPDAAVEVRKVPFRQGI
jgi:NADH-quinone oxidoreductase subunit J